MSTRVAASIATVLLAATVALVVAALTLRAGLGGGLVAMGRDWSLATAAIALSLAAVGTLIVARRPHNLVGWTLASVAVTTALAGASRYYATRALGTPSNLPAGDWAVWLFRWLIELNLALLVVVVLVFPHDRPRTRIRRGLVAFGAAAGLFGACVAALSPFDSVSQDFPFPDVANPMAVIPPYVATPLLVAYYDFVLPLGLLLPVVVAGVSFWRSRGLERQQWKMLAIGAAGLMVFIAAAFVDEGYTGFAALVGLPAIPVAIGLAVLRYHLYDIDRLIGRTVTYAAVTAVLAAVYIGSVVLLQALLSPVTADSDLAVAGSTLTVAALFGPVRRRVQLVVDRRFNRRGYDAGRAVESFGHRLRDEVDLDEVATELRRTVVGTVQPATVTVWLAREAG